MEWIPPPDGITMYQGGDVCASHERRGHPSKRLTPADAPLIDAEKLFRQIRATSERNVEALPPASEAVIVS